MSNHNDEALYAMALTRISNFNFSTALALYRELGSAAEVYAHRGDIRDVVPDCSPRLAAALKDWDEPLRRAEAEMDYCRTHGIRPLALSDCDYPRRLAECTDAPLVLYYRGNANLNERKVVSVVGTRHCTAYGQKLIADFCRDLAQLCPQTLVVSGLAYGVDICAHRASLQNGLATVGVLAHGLDRIYPSMHAETAGKMIDHGGLLTEFMTHTNPDKPNFVRRNRIVAGMSDAVVLVESAAKGGGLITTGIAQSYSRDVFAYPGPVGAPYSEGCNRLIRDNGASLITSAADMVSAMGWDADGKLLEQKKRGIERSLFPELTADEQRIVGLLQKTNDLQLNIITMRTGMTVSEVNGLLFQLEMKGVVAPYAGGVYHLM